jgi:hypothetical protein
VWSESGGEVVAAERRGGKEKASGSRSGWRGARRRVSVGDGAEHGGEGEERQGQVAEEEARWDGHGVAEVEAATVRRRPDGMGWPWRRPRQRNELLTIGG